MTRLFAIRHTSVDVPPGICYGQSDVPLRDSYLEEWAVVRETLPPIHPDEVYSSPLSRCLLMAQHLFPTVQTDARLLELNFGAWEGVSWQEIYEQAEGKQWFADYLATPTPQGESYLQLVERVSAFLRSLPSLPSIAVVTHAGVLRALQHLLTGISIEAVFDTPIGYGEVLSFDLPSPYIP